MLIRRALMLGSIPRSAPSTLLRTLQHRFAEEPQMPKSRQEAWMMQEQKRMQQKINPQEEQENKETYKGFGKMASSMFLAMIAGFSYFFYTSTQKSKKLTGSFDDSVSGMVELQEQKSIVGGDWTLIDSEGNPVSSRSLRGGYYLIMFSYTKSPSYCASALYYLSSVYRIIRNLPQGAYLRFKIIFVSIDPERDTPEVMSKFLKNFGKQVIGVTGSGPNDPELINTLKKFRVKTERVQLPKGSRKKGYEIDHSDEIYLMDPDNKYLDHIDSRKSEHETARGLMAKMVECEHRREMMQQKLQSQA